ncbi:heparan sulfate glucosamine 3-O-sulfotransferase 5 [Thrips palmi]|uniref:Heparan sulfate glucosamine 3-O-sulfotransferase 5 n=1 Tax=Thrips palmi TaxID=161013 RepID=A0A6P9A3C4_THRPL|nr:heparan sulfate glucosamine 3-O-sulfotransferase 5 [Thrips palmi]XP_034251950.1 heparan sulfate glucosamine 3-O-sulfotransferase 5 [Thrips palmi]
MRPAADSWCRWGGRLAACMLSCVLVALLVTLHALYDSAVYTIQYQGLSDEGLEAMLLANTADVSAMLTAPEIPDDPGGGGGDFGGDLGGDLTVVSGVDTNEVSDQDKDLHFEEGKDDVGRVRFPRTSRRLPQCLIIGVRKCGTRALLEMLFLHPRVQKAAGEVHFFDRDDNYSRGLEWYRKKMPHSFPHQVTIEKSPSYFVTPEVPERVRAMNASVKLLLIVREPVTRAISDYTQLRSHAATASPSPPPSGQQMQQGQRSFEELALKPDGTVNLAYRPLSTSLYYSFLHRWLDVFSRDQLLVVNGDLLIEDPVPELRRIEQFLGLEPRIGRHNFYFNHTKGFFCLRNETADKCLRETKGRRHPRVDPAVVTKLRKFFSEHNQRFYDLVGQDLGWPEE